MTTLSTQDLRAVIRLMTDARDAETLTLLRQQLTSFAVETLRELQARARQAPDHVAMEIEQALRQRVWDGVEAALGAQAASAAPELFELLVLVASFGRPELDPATLRRDVAELHMLADCRLEHDDPPLERALALADLLGNELKLHAHVGEPERLEHFYLDRILATREGSPLALGSLYLILAERLEVPVRGVLLPAGFVLGVHATPAEPAVVLYLDPARRGTVLSRLDLVEAVEKAGSPFHEEFLRPVSSRLIFARMLHTLCAVCAAGGETERHARLEHYLKLWAPHAG